MFWKISGREKCSLLQLNHHKSASSQQTLPLYNRRDFMQNLATFLLILLTAGAFAQSSVTPVIRTKNTSLTMYLDGERAKFSGINDISRDFSYDFGLEKEAVPFILVSETDSVAMVIRYGQTTRLLIIRQAKGDTVTCQFTSHKQVKAATFTNAYKKANKGKTIVDIPEVYELIHVVFALTAYGKTEAIHKNSPYYPAMIAYFSPYQKHPIVATIDSLLTVSGDNYPNLKMDSYAYQFLGDRIQNGGVYDRVSWGEVNTLAPYITRLESFARESGFRAFFRKQQPYYNQLLTDYRKNIDVATMKQWLEKQFPTTRYSAVKILFTPLVGWNQSANNFNDNGFAEAQAHVNYPFIDAEDRKQPPAVTRGQRMKIVFTELNHSYLNPEAEKYQDKVALGFSDLTKWITPKTPSAGYNNPLQCFEEYMNYGLVTLFYNDLFDRPTFETLRTRMEKGMTTQRGFRKFDTFNQELLRLYQQRKPGQTVADLYPAILDWTAKR